MIYVAQQPVTNAGVCANELLGQKRCPWRGKHKHPASKWGPRQCPSRRISFKKENATQAMVSVAIARLEVMVVRFFGNVWE